MAEKQTIRYDPQWNNMIVDDVVSQTNNVVGNFNYPPNVPAYKPIMKFLLNYPLNKAFTNCPSVVYQNFLREYWSTVVAFDPFPSTDEPEKCPLREFLIKFSVLNGQRPLTFDFKTFCSTTRLDYNNEGFSVSTSFGCKAKEREILDCDSNLPKSQGPEVPGALFKKSKRPKSKNPSTKTKVTPPKPTEGSEQSHSVSSDTVPDPQDLERNIQLASMGLPSTLNEGTHKSKPFLESTATPPKDLGGNIQPLDRDITSITSDEGTAKTTPRLEGSLGDKDSGVNIPPADMEPIHLLLLIFQGVVLNVRAFLLSDDESKEDILGAASDTDSSSDDILRKYDNILPLTERQLVKYLRKTSNSLFTRISRDNWENHEEAAVNYADLKASIDDYYDENISHRDQTDKLVEASISSLDKSINTINDLYKGLNIIFELLKEIKNADKDDFVINKKIIEATESFTKFSINITDLQSFNEYSSGSCSQTR
ncbi:hypothetical protein Tco_1227859 [Tanacetum coccineum]